MSKTLTLVKPAEAPFVPEGIPGFTEECFKKIDALESLFSLKPYELLLISVPATITRRSYCWDEPLFS